MECLFVRILTEDTHKSSNREPIECVDGSFFILTNISSTWRYADAKFFDSHTRHPSGDKMTKLMYHDDDEQNNKCEKDTKKDRHGFEDYSI